MAWKIEITVLSGVSAGDVFRFDLDVGGKISIGRLPENALVLQDNTVSRNHAEITVRDDGLYLADLGSSQGTIHMGFQLTPGREHARRLADGDEFKIGTAIFRINYPEDQFKRKEDDRLPAVGLSTPFAKLSGKRLTKKQKLLLLAGVSGIAVIFLLLPGSEEGPLGPKVVKPIPIFDLKEEIIAGTRADKLTFLVPSADLVIDYDFKSEIPIDVFLDEAKLTTLDPTSSWDHKQIIVRDLLLGRQRSLIFDSPDLPRAAGAPLGNWKQWGIQNIRISTLKSDPGVPVTDRMRAAFAAAEGVESSSTALATAVRSFQEALLALISELHIDGFAYEIPLDTVLPDKVELTELVDRIVRERTSGDISPTMLNRHLTVMSAIAGRLEAELWRRTTRRLTAAELAAAAENYIDAHDRLQEVMAMFPDTSDFRYIIAQRKFMDPNIVPKEVRRQPMKFRKRKSYED